ncbi:hypothetical protein F4782DRAFT_529511 [Xylaria castorea]|nr:hypothetical protein F4782DRAFT_529511 [Xylaria castorea]
MAGLSPRPIRKSENQYTVERRWPRKRGGYEIETRCSICRWFFDSFDPERKLCHLCLEGNLQPPLDDASIPSPTIQQSEVPQTLPDPLHSFDVPGVENTQLDNTQYQAYGQGYGAAYDPAYSQGTLSGFPGGCNIPGQMWAPGYDMSLNSSDPTGGYRQDQAYGQGYVTSPDLSFSSGTMSNPLVGYTPSQGWGQEYGNMPINPSSSFGTLSNPTGGYIQNQNYYQEDSAFSNIPQHPNEAETTSPERKPLRPLLPRERKTPRPSESEDDDDDDNDQSKESRAYRAWLKRQPAYRDAVKKRGSSSKGKASGKKKK